MLLQLLESQCSSPARNFFPLRSAASTFVNASARRCSSAVANLLSILRVLGARFIGLRNLALAHFFLPVARKGTGFDPTQRRSRYS